MTHPAVETRKFYRWEQEHIPTGRILSLLEAQCMARLVWTRMLSSTTYRKRVAREGPPRIVFGLGLKRGKARYSYCQGRSLIVLAEGQRTTDVLLHELVHALGIGRHNTRFAHLYLQLLLEFA